MYTRITFYINLLIWVTFFSWSILSYFVINSRHMIFEQKGLSVEYILFRRGEQLGYARGEFMERLLTYHSIGIILWGFVFLGLILLYRKKRLFVYFSLLPIILYLLMTIFYISWDYFMEDTTNYDKIALLVAISSLIIHSYMIKNELRGGSISFFGEATDDEESSE